MPSEISVTGSIKAIGTRRRTRLHDERPRPEFSPIRLRPRFILVPLAARSTQATDKGGGSGRMVYEIFDEIRR